MNSDILRECQQKLQLKYISHFIWKSPTVQFVLSTWVKFVGETEIYPKIEQSSYCIQFEIDTKTVKILKYNKISQASEQIIIEFYVKD